MRRASDRVRSILSGDLYITMTFFGVCQDRVVFERGQSSGEFSNRYKIKCAGNQLLDNYPYTKHRFHTNFCWDCFFYQETVHLQVSVVNKKFLW